ncbi:MAG: sensor domain-containing diguanylate cyclase, partial [Acidimicrobiales bacterium]|nr:sensor domain-containing diguanylate cyclase [Acidimicrobiales bacterium]
MSAPTTPGPEVVPGAPEAGAAEAGTEDAGALRVARLCVGLALLLVALLAGLHGTAVHVDEHGVHWGLFALVFALYLLAELFEVEIELRRETHAFALTSIPLLVGLFFLPVPLVVLARVAASAIVLRGVRHQSGVKLLFNLLSHALEIAVAGAVLAAIGAPDTLGPPAWLAAAAAVVAGDLVGGIVVTAAISLHQGSWEPSLLWGIWVPMAMAVVDLALALVIVSGLEQGWAEAWLAVPLIVFVVAVTRAYARVVARHHAMARLDAFARDLGAAVAAGDVEASLLPRVADVLRADTAWVWSPDSAEGLKRVHRVGAPDIALEPVSTFDRRTAAANDGVRLYVPEGEGGVDLGAAGLSEALVECLAIGDGHRVVIGVGDRSGVTRGFDREDARLFRTLCSHAAVALRNVGLVDRLRAESAGNEFLATHDPLTGLPNRTLFQRQLEDRLGDGGGRVAVLLIDLDRFKEVNDTLGHASGDELLIEVGRRLGPWLAPGDRFARLGGDEFALLVTAGDGDEAAARAHDVLGQLRRPFSVGEIDVDVDASIGVALPAGPVVDASSLLRQADVAMYAAKAEHTGVVVYSPDLDHYSPTRLAVVGR